MVTTIHTTPNWKLNLLGCHNFRGARVCRPGSPREIHRAVTGTTVKTATVQFGLGPLNLGSNKKSYLFQGY